MDTIIFYIFSNSLLIFVYGFNAIESITENNAMCCLIDSSWWTNQVISRYNWCNKGCCICDPVCGLGHI